MIKLFELACLVYTHITYMYSTYSTLIYIVSYVYTFQGGAQSNLSGKSDTKTAICIHMYEYG